MKKVLLVVAALLGLLVSIVALGVLMELTGEKVVPTAEEAQLVVRIEHLAEYLEHFTPEPSMVAFTKTVYFDDSYELDYEYDDPDDSAPYLSFTVTVENDAGDANATYAGEWIGLRAGLAIGAEGVSVKEDDDVFRWGDHSNFGFLVFDERPTGNVFAARKNNVVVALILAGMYFEDGEAFGELLDPVLENIEQGLVLGGR